MSAKLFKVTLSLTLFVVTMVINLTVSVRSALAACWCNDVTKCRYARPDTSNFKYDYSYSENGVKQTLKVYCGTELETRNLFSVKSPICGSSPEINPYCAYRYDHSRPDSLDTSEVTCYGAEFVLDQKGLGKTNVQALAPENRLKFVTQEIFFNGASFGSNKNLLWCNSGAFCCSRSDISCVAAKDIDPAFKEPTSPDEKWRQPDALPPTSICGGAEGGAGESRLWISGASQVAVGSKLLNSIFSPPQTEKAQADDPRTIVSKVKQHQGVDDKTRVVNKTDNNSSLIVGQEAPPPLLTDTGQCLITDTKINPGDPLAGPKIKAKLLYTQKYSYLAKSPLNCVADNLVLDPNTQKCCSKSYRSHTEYLTKFKENVTVYTCNSSDKSIGKTAGQINVFVKSPQIEFIADNLLFEPMSVFKALMPAVFTKDIKEIPAEVKYTAVGGDILKVAGETGRTPTFYVPHLGSLKQYFIDMLQKALRPADSSPLANNQNICPSTLPTLPPVDPVCQTCSISFPSSSMTNIFESAASFYKVPVSVLIGIFYNEGGLNPSWGWDDSKVVAASGPNCQVANCDSGNISSSGARGPWQFLPSTWSSFSSAATEAGVSDGRTPNICNLLDSTFAAAKKISQERGGKDRYDPPQCTGYQLNTNKGPSQSCVWNKSDIVTAARQYLGYCEDPQNPDPKYPPRESCLKDPSTCYQRSVLNISTCAVSP